MNASSSYKPFSGMFRRKVTGGRRIRLPAKFVSGPICRFRMLIVQSQFLRLIPVCDSSQAAPMKVLETQVDYGEVEVRNRYLRVLRQITGQLFKTGQVVVLGMLNVIEIFDLAVWQQKQAAALDNLHRLGSFQ